MHRVLSVAGCVLAAMGGIWTLQGLRLLPGTFMLGSMFWVWTGLLTLLLGLVFLFIGRRSRNHPYVG